VSRRTHVGLDNPCKSRIYNPKWLGSILHPILLVRGGLDPQKAR